MEQDNNGQHIEDTGSPNNGQPTALVPGSRSENDRWGAEANMKVAKTPKNADWCSSGHGCY